MRSAVIEDSFYLTEEDGLDRVIQLTELSADEIEAIVGRFRLSHYRFANLLRGEVVIHYDGSVMIRHHFRKNVMWSNAG